MDRYIIEIIDGNITIDVPFNTERAALEYACRVLRDGGFCSMRKENI